MRRLKFLASLLFTLLSPLTLHGASASWTGNANNQNWNDTSNWNPQTIPNGATDTATFGNNNNFSTGLSYDTNVLLNQIVVSGPCEGFFLGLNPNFNLVFSGAGAGAASTGVVFSGTVDNTFVGFFSQVQLSTGVNFLAQNTISTINPNVSFYNTVTGSPASFTVGSPTDTNPLTVELYQSMTNTAAAPVALNVSRNATLQLFPYAFGEYKNLTVSNFNVTIAQGGTLKGSGSFSDTSAVVNNGTVSPGIELPQGNQGTTFQFNSTYTQTVTGSLNLGFLVNFGGSLVQTSIESVGDMTLSGTLNWNAGASFLAAGTQFTLATVTGPTATLTINNLQLNPTGLGAGSSNWSNLTVVNNKLIVSVLRTQNTPPVSLDAMGKNTRSLHNSITQTGDILAQDAQANASLRNVYVQDARAFADRITRVSHIAPSITPFARHQTAVQNAASMNKKYYRGQQRSVEHERGKRSDNYPTYGIPLTGIYIEPVGVFVHQQTRGNLANNGQVGFTSATYGAMGGGIKVFDKQWVFEGGLGYTHSNLVWRDFFGNARWDSIYVAPFIGWFNTRGFANFMIMGVMNFHTTFRRILFPGVDLIAKASYKSYDMLLRWCGGIRQPMGQGYWFQPDFTFNWGTYFTNKYTENGAGGLSLNVNSTTVFILQPSIRSRFIKEYYTEKFCYAPCLYLGWLANIPLGSLNSRARFRDAPSNQLFNIQGYRNMTNQLVVGAEFYAQRFNKFIIKTYFEADLLSKLQVYIGRAKIEWVF